MRRQAPLRTAALALAAFLLGGPPAAADDVESWTDVELTLFASARAAWTVGGTLRLQDALGVAYDRRAATDVEFALTDAAQVSLGYVLLHRTWTGSGVGRDYRLRAGLTYPLLRRDIRLEGTTIYERHVGGPAGAAFDRYRQQVDIERPRARVSPWLHQSLAFEREGFVRSRSAVGIRWRFRPGHAFVGAYQFEWIRSGAAWLPRHALLSAWSLDPTVR